MSVISIKDLTKSYGKARGIENVNLTIEKGEIYGFVGPNGAGKSTTIKLLLNLIYPTNGSAQIFGKDIIKHNAEIKASIGYVPSEVRYYPYLTGEDMLKTTIAFSKNKDFMSIDELCKKLDIDKYKKMGQLSLGNKKKIAIACALITKPNLIILDEPTSSLDPLIQKRLFELLKEQNENGATIFISSHNLNEVQEHCTKVAFIKDGKILKIQDLSCGVLYSKIVTIFASNLNREIFESIGATIISDSKEQIKLSYKGDIAKILDIIASFKPTDLTIENISLEDEFITYYEGGMANENL